MEANLIFPVWLIITLSHWKLWSNTEIKRIKISKAVHSSKYSSLHFYLCWLVSHLCSKSPPNSSAPLISCIPMPDIQKLWQQIRQRHQSGDISVTVLKLSLKAFRGDMYEFCIWRILGSLGVRGFEGRFKGSQKVLLVGGGVAIRKRLMQSSCTILTGLQMVLFY